MLALMRFYFIAVSARYWNKTRRGGLRMFYKGGV